MVGSGLDVSHHPERCASMNQSTPTHTRENLMLPQELDQSFPGHLHTGITSQRIHDSDPDPPSFAIRLDLFDLLLYQFDDCVVADRIAHLDRYRGGLGGVRIADVLHGAAAGVVDA